MGCPLKWSLSKDSRAAAVIRDIINFGTISVPNQPKNRFRSWQYDGKKTNQAIAVIGGLINSKQIQDRFEFQKRFAQSVKPESIKDPSD